MLYSCTHMATVGVKGDRGTINWIQSILHVMIRLRIYDTKTLLWIMHEMAVVCRFNVAHV